MTRDISEILNALDLPEIFPFFAVELMFDTSTTTFNDESVSTGPLYLWTGLGDLTIGDITYIGTGNLIQIGEVQETAQISAHGMSFTMSGIPEDILAIALQLPYRGRVCRVKFGIMDANKEYLLLESGDRLLLENSAAIDISAGDPNGLSTLFVGYMDQMGIAEGPDSSTVTLTAESKLINLERPRTRRYTSENQKSLFPGDLAFDFVNDLVDRPSAWGRD